MIDLLFQTLIACALALLFLGAALHKWRGGLRFEAQLSEYRLLPERLVGPVARLLAVLESLVAIALVLPQTRALAALVAAGLLFAYGGAIAVNLLRGRSHIDCGCGDTPQMLSPWLLLRNALLAGGALLVALPAADRALGWTDLALGLPALLVLVITYQLAEQLLENASVLREWREARD